MSIALGEYGKFVSIARYRIAKKINKAIEFEYVHDNLEAMYSKGKTVIDTIYYSDDEESVYNTNIRTRDKDTNKECKIESSDRTSYLTIDRYIGVINSTIVNNKSDNIVLSKLIEKVTYDIAKDKNEVNKTFNYTLKLANGFDFIIGDIPEGYTLINYANISITIVTSEGKLETHYMVFGNTLSTVDFSESIVIENYDFTDPNNIQLYTMDNIIDNSARYQGIFNLSLEPTLFIDNENREIKLEYDENGILMDTNDTKYPTLYYSRGNVFLSIHPVYVDLFNPSTIYNKNFYCVDQYEVEADGKFDHYTRFIVEVEDIEKLINDIKDESIVTMVEFENYYPEEEVDEDLPSTKEEFIEAEKKRIQELFKKKED